MTNSDRPSRRDFVTSALGVGASVMAGGPILAGCAGSESGGSAEAGADPAAVENGPKTVPNKDVFYPEDYVGPVASRKGPIVVKDEKVTLRVVVPQDPIVGDWAENRFTKWYEQRTGVHVEWQVVGGEETDRLTKVNAMIASGDIPDVFMNVDFTTSQQMLYGSQGLFVPLEKYIEEYGVETKRIMQAYPDAKQLMTAPDGHIYSMPYINDCYHCATWGNRVWVYQPWLDKLGLDVPETLDEFENVLEAFVRGDPNGNGEADETPFMSFKDEPLDQFVMGSFLYNPGEPWLVLDDGKVDVVFDKDGWREGLRYLARLYRKGLLAKQSFTQTMEQFQRYGNRQGPPILGMARAGAWMSFISIEDMSKDARWRQYVTVPNLAGPDGTRIAGWDYYGAVQTGRFVVTKACKNPAVATMWADGQYELEAILRAYSGPLGKGFRWAKEGEVSIDGKQAVWAAVDTDGEQLENSVWNQLGVDFRSQDFRLAEVSDPQNPSFETPLHEESKKYYALRQPKQQQLPPLYLTEAQAAQAGELAVTLKNQVTTSFSGFVLGDLDINDDREWEKYVDTIRSMGLDRYLKIHQDAYEATVK